MQASRCHQKLAGKNSKPLYNLWIDKTAKTLLLITEADQRPMVILEDLQRSSAQVEKCVENL